MILLHVIVLISILLIVFSLNSTFNNSNKEQFDAFNIDSNELINEHSIRFFKDRPYNDQRGAFAFRNIDYFVKNKDNIFKHYNTDQRIISFYEKNRNESFEPITDKLEPDSSQTPEDTKKFLDKFSYGSNQVGMGFDKDTNSSKIYILDRTSIKSLKIVNGKEINSIYHIIPNFDDKNMIDFCGKENTEKIKNNLATIKIYKDDYLVNLENNKNMLIKLLGNKEFEKYKNTILKSNKSNGQVPLKFEDLNCYNRFDNDKLIGYHFDFSDFNLKLEKDQQFIKNLLIDLGYNIELIDTWINNNKSAVLNWISFIKSNNKDSITIYYRD